MSFTADFWHDWLAHGDFPDHPWRKYLQRSALTLKGLTYAPTGAMCAASTTSLPETPGGERNWDYRYSWIRDSAFMLWGLHSLGFTQEAGDYYYFIEDVAAGDELQVLYGIGGERHIEESELDHLEGYEHSQPVRVGNAAYNQNQHDVWGTLLDSVYIHTKNRDQLPESAWPILARQVEEAIEHWREPDRGIWEVRGEPKHFTSSKIFCWLALRPRRAPRAAAQRHRRPRPAGRRSPTRSAPTSSRTASTRSASLRPALRQRRARRRAAADPARPLPARRRRARPQHRLRDRRRARRGRPDPALQGRRDRRRARGRGGHVRDLLVVDGLRARRDRRARPRPADVREAARLREPAAALRRGDRRRHGPPPRQLPAGVHAPRADQRGDEADRRRGGDARRDAVARQGRAAPGMHGELFRASDRR